MRLVSHLSFMLFFSLLLGLSGCCSKAPGPAINALTEFRRDTTDRILPEIPNSYIPKFLIKNSEDHYNRIGTPGAELTEKGDVQIVVDATASTLYFEKDSFSTQRGKYTNLIYRVHFEKVPLGLNCLNLTAGKNPGILIIYTLNSEKNIILITLVHTCGCYLAFIPTSNLPENALPRDWPSENQIIYGCSLPAFLPSPDKTPGSSYLFTIESETHRIGDVTLIDSDYFSEGPVIPLRVSPMEALYYLPYHDSTVSFFENEGSRRGYVKNNTKILERILISWWAFDLHVGEDKEFGKNANGDLPFYTSLKFWQRHASDMRDFPAFLAYWGWKL